MKAVRLHFLKADKNQTYFYACNTEQVLQGEYYPKAEAYAEIARLEVEVERLKRGLRLIGKIADSEEIGPELMDELEQLRSELKTISGRR